MRSITVYKLGGSLLLLPDLAARLERLFAREPSGVRRLVVVGGGPTADVVRAWDRVHGLGHERAHRLAIQALQLNESLVSELLPGSRIVRSSAEAEHAWDRGEVSILCLHDFLRTAEPGAPLPLPHTWNVTSDSLAAWVAAVWPAGRLVLLKSTSLARRDGPLAGEMPVDPHFPQLAPHVAEIGWVNLRDESPALESWPPEWWI
ncbi:MAG TPA: hypothetical protein VML55_03825 [Planctomycetaceae bacterium]|nr:hypothetical protein [Planctomycetaceae bacterium]